MSAAKTFAEIVADARDRYTVHNCNECNYRKSCDMHFGDLGCGNKRQSIALLLGIEDGYFSDLLNSMEAAHKRDLDNQHPYADFGGAGVATLHKYEVRETVAGRCNLVATFTDPNRAEEYAARIAREG